MKRYLIAGVLVFAFVSPALAEQFYVAFDPASHKCTMMHSQPAAPMKAWAAHSRLKQRPTRQWPA
jgi:hypothetical protein